MSMSLDKWREYFRSANSDIFDIIEHAIIVAASDCPYDFKVKRDRIAEVLFACKSRRCFGCDRVELAAPDGVVFEKSEGKYKSDVDAGGSKDTKESKANCSSRDFDDDDDDDEDDDVRRQASETNANQISNYSYGDAEALTDEIEEESQFYQEALRIKEIFDNSDQESNSLLIENLRKLQLMPLSVEALKATEIGKSVNALRKHQSKEIRSLARALIEEWKIMVDSWACATAEIAGAENATESVKTSAVEDEEEGLPSPPLDEGAFFATPTSMELSQFFDGMDDDGNPQSGGDIYTNRESIRKPAPAKIEPRTYKPEQKRNAETTLKKQAPPPRPNRPLNGELGSGRSKPPSNENAARRPNPALKPKPNSGINNGVTKLDNGAIQKKPIRPQQEPNCDNENSVGMKLEAAKRKLQERYQEAENAKKQRTIQVVELRDLPKQSLAPRNHHARLGNHNRNWANGRR
ncbi:probable mediator of RNA polymerase II transcription subunit 26b isoform X2 [Andrographis paniculata]|uniref:probable mediator of RNA polymerase II transcription subunit 26b isoform X2 n=1 Tax=Andrographis paniculata TaxID=175694 RepID=UPI0021E8FF89|nr:probable mediator of RNA polymerase II transcription subunit 26b isoform X2 [Andrographis paniculata]